jgi:hypothetical protein
MGCQRIARKAVFTFGAFRIKDVVNLLTKGWSGHGKHAAHAKRYVSVIEVIGS